MTTFIIKNTATIEWDDLSGAVSVRTMHYQYYNLITIKVILYYQ